MVITGVLSQTTIETIIPDSITGTAHGEIIGTGTDGTTYRISETVSGLAITGS